MKKGFTLIELLAVIVILAIIALIAVPRILNIVEKARKGAAESSALGYIDAVEKQIIINQMDNNNDNDILDNKYTVAQLKNYNISVKGNTPSNGWIIIEKSKITDYELIIDGYKISKNSETKKDDSNDFKVGDYVSMTPTLTSYTIPTSLTGYSKDQTINPSSLNLWRILKINDDDTIDMISEYVTDNMVNFGASDIDSDSNKTIYENSIYTFKLIANSFQNDKYTISARIPGYNNQIEKLDSSKINYDELIWTCSTDDENCNTVEEQGGGDTKYKSDLKLIENVYGNYNADFVTPRKWQQYYLASREYNYIEDSNNLKYASYNIRTIYKGSNGNTSMLSLKKIYVHFFEKTGSYGFGSYGTGIRPIVTLKSGLKKTGSGTKSDPWVLES